MEPELHPEFAARGTFEHLKLGRNKKRDDKRTLHLADYLDEQAVLPQVPETCDWTAGVASWPMYDNDRLGNCTCAAAAHMVQAWAQAAGTPRTPALADIDGLYWATGSQDDGRSEMDVLNYWRQNGMGADKIDAYVSVDPSNPAHVKAGISIFGGLYAGIGLPLTAQGQSLWDVVPDMPSRNEPYSWGGHAVPYLYYGSDGKFGVVTWGGVVLLTGAFHDEYTDELYAIVSADFFNAAGKSPAGFDMEAMEADLTALS